MTEKRRFPRLLTRIPADVRIVPQATGRRPSDPIGALIRDLSVGGVGMEIPRISAAGPYLYKSGSFPAQGRLYLDWTFPSGEVVKALGQTVWCANVPGTDTIYLAGLRFQGVSHRELEIISDFLEVSRQDHGETKRPVGLLSVCAWICGRSYGNPGPSGIGVVLTDEGGKVLTQLSEYLGKLSNPAAEYQALIAALTEAKKMKARRITIYLDSVFLRLEVGGTGVKSPAAHLEPLAIMARALMASFSRVEMISVPSERNRKAQVLAERAIMTSGAVGRPVR